MNKKYLIPNLLRLKLLHECNTFKNIDIKSKVTQEYKPKFNFNLFTYQYILEIKFHTYSKIEHLKVKVNSSPLKCTATPLSIIGTVAKNTHQKASINICCTGRKNTSTESFCCIIRASSNIKTKTVSSQLSHNPEVKSKNHLIFCLKISFKSNGIFRECP